MKEAAEICRRAAERVAECVERYSCLALRREIEKLPEFHRGSYQPALSYADVMAPKDSPHLTARHVEGGDRAYEAMRTQDVESEYRNHRVMMLLLMAEILESEGV